MTLHDFCEFNVPSRWKKNTFVRIPWKHAWIQDLGSWPQLCWSWKYSLLFLRAAILHSISPVLTDALYPLGVCPQSLVLLQLERTCLRGRAFCATRRTQRLRKRHQRVILNSFLEWQRLGTSWAVFCRKDVLVELMLLNDAVDRT